MSGGKFSRALLGPDPAGRSDSWHYGFAAVLMVGAITVAILLRVVLIEGDVPVYALLVAAAGLAAVYGGLGPGIVATAVGWTLALWLVVDLDFFAIGSRREMIHWTGSLAVALWLVLSTAVVRRGRERATAAVDAAETSIRDLEALQAVSLRLAAAVTVPQVVHALIEDAAEALGARAVALGFVEGDELVIAEPSGVDLARGQRIALTGRVAITRAAADESVVRALDRETLEAMFPDTAALSTSATGAIAVPLRRGEQVVGSLGFLFEGEMRAGAEGVARIAADLGGLALERARLYEQERESRQALDRILRVAPRFHADSSEAVAQAICREARLTFGADLGILWRVRESGLELVAADPSHGALPTGLEPDLEDFLGLRDAVGEVKVGFVSDVQEEARGAGLERVRALGLHSSLRVPIAIGGRTERVLTISWETVVSEPHPSTMVIARRLADQAGLALEELERRRAEAEAARRADEMRRLQEVTAALSLASTATDVSNTCLEHALAAVGAEAGFVVLAHAEGATVELVASSGYSDAELETWRGLALDMDYPATRALATGEPVWALEAEAMAEFAAAGRHPADRGWVALPLRTLAGVRGALHLSFRMPRQLGDDERRWLQTAVSQCALALERSRLFDEEQLLRARSEQLQGMTAALSNALTRADVANVAVEQIGKALGAAAAALGEVDEQRQLLRIIAWRGYSDDAIESWLEVPLDAPLPANRAIRRRASVFVESLAGMQAEFPVAAEAFADEGHAAVVFVPLVAGRRANGVVVASWAEPHVFTDDERGFVEALAGQAALALDRALLFESERTIAETLQRSVLPASLPRVPGVQMAARYLPGTMGLEVGGDWFDAFRLPEGRLGLVVGDVVGKGVQAAATMAQLRNGLRAYALDGLQPLSTVARLNHLADEMLDSPFATMAYVVVDPAAGLCSFTSAGHPPPVVVFPDGRVELLEDGRGLPLGAAADTDYGEGVVNLPVGGVLLLYTDGLVERRDRSIDEGLELLRKAAAEGPREPERLVEHLIEQLVGTTERGDDIALLAIRLFAVAPQPLELSVPSDEGSLELVRDALRVWLEGVPLSGVDAHNVVLAAWEGCANAIEHAREPGADRISVRAETMDSKVRITVEGTGRWTAPAERPDRGLGLQLMHSLMSSVEITPSDGGTVVTFDKTIAETGEAERQD